MKIKSDPASRDVKLMLATFPKFGNASRRASISFAGLQIMNMQGKMIQTPLFLPTIFIFTSAKDIDAALEQFSLKRFFE